MSNADWLPAILELGDNKTPAKFDSQFQKVGVVPFVGAGLSAPYNLPQWSESIQSLATDEKTRTRVKGARTNMIVPLNYELSSHQLPAIAPE